MRKTAPRDYPRLGRRDQLLATLAVEEQRLLERSAALAVQAFNPLPSRETWRPALVGHRWPLPVVPLEDWAAS